MADSIGELLMQKDLGEPGEVLIIKNFLLDNYRAACNVSINNQQIVIAVAGASLAGALRMRLHELQGLCKTDKRLVLRIIS